MKQKDPISCRQNTVVLQNWQLLLPAASRAVEPDVRTAAGGSHRARLRACLLPGSALVRDSLSLIRVQGLQKERKQRVHIVPCWLGGEEEDGFLA